MRKIILCRLLICLFPINVSASSGYKEITGGTTTLPLGHNQIVRITDLPIGSSYTVSEDEEDYIQTTEGKTSWLFRTPDQKQVVVFTNKKDGVIPTGILLNNGTILIGIGSISILVLKLRRKKKYEN